MLCYSILFIKVQETAKQLQSNCKENCKAFKCYSLNAFPCFQFSVLQFCSDKDMYRKNEIFGRGCSAKIVPSGWGGFGRVVFCSALQNCKEFYEVLDFQRFAVLQ